MGPQPPEKNSLRENAPSFDDFHSKIPGMHKWYGVTPVLDDYPDNFGLAVEWLYKKKLQPLRSPLRCGGSPAAWAYNLIKLYAFATKLGNQKLLKAIMDEWIGSDAAYMCLPDLEVVDAVYSSLPAGSPPRKYVSWAICLAMSETKENIKLGPEQLQSMFEKHPELKSDVDRHLQEEKPFDRVRDPRAVSPSEFCPEEANKETEAKT
jgi:hypothetical protein